MIDHNLSQVQESTSSIIIAPVKESQENSKSTKTKKKDSFNNLLKYCLALGFGAGLLAHGFLKFHPGNYIGLILGNEKAVADTATTNSSIATTYQNNIPVPDWSSITFKDMKFLEPGSVEFPNIKNPGMKETRTWQAGQSLDEVMELGDFEETEFGIEELTLKQISEISKINLKNFKLNELELINWQTPANLVKAIPKLDKQLVKNVPPIRDLLKKLGINGAGNLTISKAVNKYAKFAKTPLGNLGVKNLSKYKLTDIPGIDKAQLKKFYNWQNNTISKVPGLNSVPFSQFPGIPQPDFSFVGKVDLPLGELESNRQRSISGSYQEGFNVSCNTKCAHIEIAGAGQVTGTQWMSGKYQKVKGGFGILGKLNGGKEPTGRHPFGKAFKQVVWNINEEKGSVTTTMFFRICKRGGLIDLGCSPYFIGPVPFFTYREMSPIILGSPLNIP